MIRLIERHLPFLTGISILFGIFWQLAKHYGWVGKPAVTQ